MAVSVAPPAESKEKNRKPKFTFMLHDPNNMSSLGKYVATDYRYAALKAATRGHTKIMLRKTNSKTVHEFNGQVVTLDTPKQISRGDRTISYNKKPKVERVRVFDFDGALPEDETDEAQKST